MLWKHGNTLSSEISTFYLYALFQKFRTPFDSEPATPLHTVQKYCLSNALNLKMTSLTQGTSTELSRSKTDKWYDFLLHSLFHIAQHQSHSSFFCSILKLLWSKRFSKVFYKWTLNSQCGNKCIAHMKLGTKKKRKNPVKDFIIWLHWINKQGMHSIEMVCKIIFFSDSVTIH